MMTVQYMMTVQFRFVGESAISSEMISWFSAGHISHVDYVCPGAQPPNLLGARLSGGVSIRPNDYLKVSRIALISLPATDAQATALDKFFSDQVGKPYDWRAIVAFFTNRDWHQRDSWICSELILAGLQSVGLIPDHLLLAANKVTPMALAFLLSSRPGAQVELTGRWPEQCVPQSDK